MSKNDLCFSDPSNLISRQLEENSQPWRNKIQNFDTERMNVMENNNYNLASQNINFCNFFLIYNFTTKIGIKGFLTSLIQRIFPWKVTQMKAMGIAITTII